MGFLLKEGSKKDRVLKDPPVEFLREQGCHACPLNGAEGLRNPKMPPSGSEHPEVLFIGGAPTEREDKTGEYFDGKYAKILHKLIPERFEGRVRFTGSLNCRTHDKSTNFVELNCCYPRLVADIERMRPKAIFGFGYAPLFQIVNPDAKYRKMGVWRGRRVPVQIGKHAFWYYAFEHPLDIIRAKFYGKRIEKGYGSQDEFALELDVRRAFAEVEAGLPPATIHTREVASADVELLYNIDDIADRLDEASYQVTAGFDIETNRLRPYSAGAKILTMGISTKMGAFAFPVDHPGHIWTPKQRKQLDELIRRFLYESSCAKIVHSLAFELEWLGFFWGAGLFYATRWEDSLSQGYILDARRGGLSLDFLCFILFGIRLKEISNLDRTKLEFEPVDSVLKYNGIDARYHRLLFLRLLKLIEHHGLVVVYEHQLRRIFALVALQMHGVPVDQGVVKELRKKYEDRAAAIALQIQADPMCREFEKNKKGKTFNPASSLHVKYMMVDLLGEDIESTEKGELDKIKHPLAKNIVQFRETNKVLSTYILPVDAEEEDTCIFPDGMLHPITSTTTVVSWRTSSTDNNIQNWPKRDDERKEVRSQVRSPDRNIRVVSIDYAGIQARNVAMESKDKKLVDAFWHNYDIHSDWRERIARSAPGWIPKSKRQDKEALAHFRYLAKNKFVFPTFFGAHAYSMSLNLGIPYDVCQDLKDEFFDNFKGIKKWHDKLDVMYYDEGYVTGLSGFICRAPISSNQRINLPIQGDEAIIVLDATSRLSEMEDPRYRPMLEVHDDLTFLWPKNEIEKRLEVVVKTMITIPFEWANIVPIEVEVSYGEDWIHMEKVGSFVSDGCGGIKNAKS